MLVKKSFNQLLFILIILFMSSISFAADRQTTDPSGGEGLKEEGVKETGPATGPSPLTGVVKKEAEAEPEEIPEEPDIADPIEPINRAFFTFNDRLYFWVMKPVANAYNFFVPEWGRVRVRNAFHNIAMPIRFVNCILQLQLHSAAAELGRFVVNSTAGLGGMFVVVKETPEIKTSERDMGQTFGVYGIGEGFYLVLPVLGPSSARDAVGSAGDGFLDPIDYITPYRNVIAVQGYKQVNDTSLRIGEYEDLKESAVDPYIAVRDAYKQYRRSKLKE